MWGGWTLTALTAGSEIQLLPCGEFRTVDGRPVDAPYWFVDADIAAVLIADFGKRANPASTPIPDCALR